MNIPEFIDNYKIKKEVKKSQEKIILESAGKEDRINNIKVLKAMYWVTKSESKKNKIDSLIYLIISVLMCIQCIFVVLNPEIFIK